MQRIKSVRYRLPSYLSWVFTKGRVLKARIICDQFVNFYPARKTRTRSSNWCEWSLMAQMFHRTLCVKALPSLSLTPNAPQIMPLPSNLLFVDRQCTNAMSSSSWLKPLPKGAHTIKVELISVRSKVDSYFLIARSKAKGIFWKLVVGAIYEHIIFRYTVVRCLA